MKRAILVIIVLLFCAIPVFANDAQTADVIKLGEEKAYTYYIRDTDYNYSAETEHYYTFVAPSTGGYKINVDDFLKDETYIEVHDESGEEIAFTGWDQYKNQVALFIKMSKGELYYIRIACYPEENTSVTTTTTITRFPEGSTTISSLKPGKKQITVKLKKKSVSGYQVQIATDKKFKKNKKTVNVKKNKAIFKKLKAKKKYYVRVRTFSYGDYSEKFFSNWSKTKSVKTK